MDIKKFVCNLHNWTWHHYETMNGFHQDSALFSNYSTSYVKVIGTMSGSDLQRFARIGVDSTIVQYLVVEGHLKNTNPRRRSVHLFCSRTKDVYS